MIVTADKPHIVLRCNPAFTALSGLQLNDIIGMPLRETPLFGINSEIALADEFSVNMTTNKSLGSHAVLTLYQSLVVGNVVKFQSPSLYSLHAFPVFKRKGAVTSSGSMSSAASGGRQFFSTADTPETLHYDSTGCKQGE